jgi:exodeoxyribonuclease VII large subunit
VGLITSRGSAAEQDFRTGLEASGYPFRIELVDCRVQGEQVAPQVTAALAQLARRGCDAVVITRGGGSRADLSWFDQQELCVAIARCPLPVITAIGHEIDTSLADLCAHTRCKTPTAAAEFLADRVAAQADRLEEAARALSTTALARLDAAQRRLEAGERLPRLFTGAVREAGRHLHALTTRLELRTGRATGRWQQRLQGLALRAAAGAGRRLEASGRRTDYLARSLIREAPRAGVQGSRRLDGLAEKLRLLDPRRLLERGFTLTLAADGRPLTRAAQVVPGQILNTRFADGDITSIAGGPRPARKPKGGRGGGEEEDSGQQALF